MIVHKTSIFPAERHEVFSRLQKLKTLQKVAWPYATFTPADGNKDALWACAFYAHRQRKWIRVLRGRSKNEMKLEKSFIYKDFYKDLADRYGEEKASAIWQYAEEEYERLKAEHEDADQNSISFVFPPAALYRAIEHHAPGEALELCRAYGAKTGIRFRNIFRKVTALPGVPDLMWKNMDKIGAKMSEGYDVEDLVITEHLCSLNVTRCPLYDKAKEIGTPEAVQMICCMDKEYMTGFRGVDYTRTKSVAEGDECCDYRLRDSRNGDAKRKAIIAGGVVLCAVFAGLLGGYKKK